MYVDRSSFSHIAHVSTATFPILIVYVDTSKYITCPFSGPVEEEDGGRSYIEEEDGGENSRKEAGF